MRLPMWAVLPHFSMPAPLAVEEETLDFLLPVVLPVVQYRAARMNAAVAPLEQCCSTTVQVAWTLLVVEVMQEVQVV